MIADIFVNIVNEYNTNGISGACERIFIDEEVGHLRATELLKHLIENKLHKELIILISTAEMKEQSTIKAEILKTSFAFYNHVDPALQASMNLALLKLACKLVSEQDSELATIQRITYARHVLRKPQLDIFAAYNYEQFPDSDVLDTALAKKAEHNSSTLLSFNKYKALKIGLAALTIAGLAGSAYLYKADSKPSQKA